MSHGFDWEVYRESVQLYQVRDEHVESCRAALLNRHCRTCELVKRDVERAEEKLGRSSS